MLIKSARDLGNAIKAARQIQKMTQTDLAGASGTGLRFIVDLEKGKPTCELEKSLRVAAMLGLKLHSIEQEDRIIDG